MSAVESIVRAGAARPAGPRGVWAQRRPRHAARAEDAASGRHADRARTRRAPGRSVPRARAEPRRAEVAAPRRDRGRVHDRRRRPTGTASPMPAASAPRCSSSRTTTWASRRCRSTSTGATSRVSGGPSSTTCRPPSVRAAFSRLVLSDRVLDQLGPAVRAGRSLFVYGPPGNGKTVISQAIRNLLVGEIAVPHALAVEGCHHPVLRPGEPRGAAGRWRTVGERTPLDRGYLPGRRAGCAAGAPRSRSAAS